MKALSGLILAGFLFLDWSSMRVSAVPVSQAGVTIRPFGQCAEGPVNLHTLTNANGLSVSIMDYGATVVSVVTPDRQGHLEDIALGFDHPANYAAAKLNFGTIGRYINR